VTLAVPAAAAAGTVTAGNFAAAPGEKNDVRYDAYGSPPVTVFDLGAPLIVGSGCTDGAPVACDYTSGVTLHLGDRSDRGWASATFVAIVHGEDGADVIHADSEEPQAYGGAGDDQIEVSGNQIRAWGGRGNDALQGPLQTAVTAYLAGEEGDDTLIEKRYGGRCTFEGGRGDDRIVTFSCTQRGGPGRDVMSRVLHEPAGGAMSGDEGGDIMIGGLAADSFDGGPGGDFIQAAVDGVADTIVCGDGNDIVRANAVDDVAADCENVTRVEPPPSGGS
jgi:Ca2+-binding RTX toxin-like protein